MDPAFAIAAEQGVLIVSASGENRTGGALSDRARAGNTAKVLKSLDAPGLTAVRFLAPGLDAWDPLLLARLLSVAREAEARGLSVDASGLPHGMGRVLDMALAVPPQNAGGRAEEPGFLETVGEKALAWPKIASAVLDFLGAITQSLARLLAGRASVSSRDVWAVFRECGVDALPIVTLTSLLLGLILAFVSSMQLKLFGAEVYVASLVSVSMVRVMGPVLTGIVLAGRTGASFAAVIGSMQVNEEVDALQSFGIRPVDFLVLPRVLGMVLMTPLLTVYADVAGISGGFLVGALMLDIAPAVYIENALSFLSLSYLWIGLFHALVFGFIISFAGCYEGMNCERNAAAVGRAATAAVVNSIVGIIVATSIITVILTEIGL
ncbi:ABC transporter permease [uncultured Mailhella sp.]|uniref:MlaE family ABC transporter permease n=1 Tax=uncultured Mailhella sp. TaxID=1981031 RepID=UPI00260717CB|nr:ABC transporter permease [uncultured Mailhella sp.]